MDHHWLYAMGLTGHNVPDSIKTMYEKGGYKVFSVQPIKPKRTVIVDLRKLWDEAEHESEVAEYE